MLPEPNQETPASSAWPSATRIEKPLDDKLRATSHSRVSGWSEEQAVREEVSLLRLVLFKFSPLSFDASSALKADSDERERRKLPSSNRAVLWTGGWGALNYRGKTLGGVAILLSFRTFCGRLFCTAQRCQNAIERKTME